MIKFVVGREFYDIFFVFNEVTLLKLCRFTLKHIRVL
jgi:hypothetical protein